MSLKTSSNCDESGNDSHRMQELSQGAFESIESRHSAVSSHAVILPGSAPPTPSAQTVGLSSSAPQTASSQPVGSTGALTRETRADQILNKPFEKCMCTGCCCKGGPLSPTELAKLEASIEAPNTGSSDTPVDTRPERTGQETNHGSNSALSNDNSNTSNQANPLLHGDLGDVQRPNQNLCLSYCQRILRFFQKVINFLKEIEPLFLFGRFICAVIQTFLSR